MCKRTPRIPHQLRTANSYRFASAPESTPDPAQTGQSQLSALNAGWRDPRPYLSESRPHPTHASL